MSDEPFKSYVVDCNVIVKWFLAEEHSEKALLLLESAATSKVILYAPEIIRYEFTGVLTKYNKLKFLTSQECKKYFNELSKIIDQNILKLASLNNNLEEVFDLAIKETILYNDAEYLYLSKKLNADLITYDKHLSKIANR